MQELPETSDLPTLADILDANPALKETLDKAKRKVKRGSKPKKYVSPFRRAKEDLRYVAEIVCIECKLPSFRGLPPFIAVNRLVDGEIRKTLRHYTCPKNPKKLLKDIERIRATNKAMFEARQKLDFTRKGGRKWQPVRR